MFYVDKWIWIVFNTYIFKTSSKKMKKNQFTFSNCQDIGIIFDNYLQNFGNLLYSKPIVGLQRLLALCSFVVDLLNKKIKITFQFILTNSPRRWVWYVKGLRYCIVWYKWRSVKIQQRIRASTIVRLKTEKNKIDLKYFFKRMRIAIIQNYLTKRIDLK